MWVFPANECGEFSRKSNGKLTPVFLLAHGTIFPRPIEILQALLMPTFFRSIISKTREVHIPRIGSPTSARTSWQMTRSVRPALLATVAHHFGFAGQCSRGQLHPVYTTDIKNHAYRPIIRYNSFLSYQKTPIRHVSFFNQAQAQMY